MALDASQRIKWSLETKRERVIQCGSVCRLLGRLVHISSASRTTHRVVSCYDTYEQDHVHGVQGYPIESRRCPLMSKLAAQRFTRTQRSSSLSAFSIQTGQSETIRYSRRVFGGWQTDLSWTSLCRCYDFRIGKTVKLSRRSVRDSPG